MKRYVYEYTTQDGKVRKAVVDEDKRTEFLEKYPDAKLVSTVDGDQGKKQEEDFQQDSPQRESESSPQLPALKFDEFGRPVEQSAQKEDKDQLTADEELDLESRSQDGSSDSSSRRTKTGVARDIGLEAVQAAVEEAKPTSEAVDTPAVVSEKELFKVVNEEEQARRNRVAELAQKDQDAFAQIYRDNINYPGINVSQAGVAFGNAVNVVLPDGQVAYIDLAQDPNSEEGQDAMRKIEQIDQWYDQVGKTSRFNKTNASGVNNLFIFDILGRRDTNYKGGAKGVYNRADIESMNRSLWAAEYRIEETYDNFGKLIVGKYRLIKYGPGIGEDVFDKTVNADEIQKYFWDNITDDELDAIARYNSEIALKMIEDSGAYETLKRGEMVSNKYSSIPNEEAITGAVNTANGAAVAMEAALIEQNFNPEVAAEIGKYLSSPIKEVEESYNPYSGTTRSVSTSPTSGQTRLDQLMQVLNQGYYISYENKEQGEKVELNLDPTSIERVFNLLNPGDAPGDESSFYTYLQKEADKYRLDTSIDFGSVMLEQQYRNSPDYVGIRSFVDGSYTKFTVEEQLEEFESRTVFLSDEIKKFAVDSKAEMDGFLEEVKSAGAGLKPVGTGVGMQLIVEHDDEETRKRLQKRVNGLMLANRNKYDEFSMAAERLDVDYRAWTKNNQEDKVVRDIVSGAISKEFDTSYVVTRDIANGFESIFTGVASFFGSEEAMERAEMTAGGDIGVESNLTYEQAAELGETGRFAGRVLAQQAANTVVAMGGAALGLPTWSTPAIFGLSSGGQKRQEIGAKVDAGKEAEEKLANLQEMQQEMDPLDYVRQKLELEKTIEFGNLTALEQEAAVWSAAVIEGGVSYMLGTVPNSYSAVRDVVQEVTTRGITRSSLQLYANAFWDFSKRTLGEVVEEELIYVGTELTDGLFLGDQMDFSQLDDTAITSIIMAGPMNGPTILYNAVVTQQQTKEMRARVRGVLDDIKNIEEELIKTTGTDKASAMYRDALKLELREAYKDLGLARTDMEIDALVTSSEDIASIIDVSVALEGLYRSAGVISFDSEESRQKKVQDHIETLKETKPRQAEAFENQLDSLVEAREKLLAKTAGKIEVGDIADLAFDMYGQVGTDVLGEINENGVKDLIGQDNLTPEEFQELDKRQQLQIVHRITQDKIRDRVIDEAKKDYALREQVRLTVYGDVVVYNANGKNQFVNKKDKDKFLRENPDAKQVTGVFPRELRDIRRENLEFYRVGVKTNAIRSRGLLQHQLGTRRLSDIVAENEARGGEKINVVRASSVDEYIEEVNRLEGLSPEDKANLIELAGGIEPTTQGFVYGNTIVVLSTIEEGADLEDIQIASSTEVHELGHMINSRAFAEGDVSKIADGLREFSQGDEDLKAIYDQAVRVTRERYSSYFDPSKKISDQSNEFKDELVQQYVNLLDDNRKAQVKMRKARQSFKNWFRGKFKGDFKIETAADAATYVINFLDSFNLGELSQYAVRSMEHRASRVDKVLRKRLKEARRDIKKNGEPSESTINKFVESIPNKYGLLEDVLAQGVGSDITFQDGKFVSSPLKVKETSSGIDPETGVFMVNTNIGIAFAIDRNGDVLYTKQTEIDTSKESRHNNSILLQAQDIVDKAQEKAGQKKYSYSGKKDVEPVVNSLLEGWTDETWKEMGAEFAMGTIVSEKMLDGLIAAKLKVPMSYEDTQDFIQRVYGAIYKHVKNFKPSKNDDLFGWINSQLFNYATQVYNKEYKQTDEARKTVDIDQTDEKGNAYIQIADEGDTTQDVTDDITIDFTKEDPLSAQEEVIRSTLRRNLGFTEEMSEEVRNAVRRTFGTKLPAPTDKRFIKKLNLEYEKALKGFINDQFFFKDRKQVIAFIEEHGEAIFDELPASVWGKMESRVEDDKRIFTNKKTGASPTEVDDAISKGLLAPDVSRTSGPTIYTKKPYPGNEAMLAFFLGVNAEAVLGKSISPSLLSNRRSKLAGEIAIKLAGDATMEVLGEVEVMQRRAEIASLEDRRLDDNELAVIANKLHRDPRLRFSKKPKKVKEDQLEAIQEVQDEIVRAVIEGKITKEDAFDRAQQNFRRTQVYVPSRKQKEIDSKYKAKQRRPAVRFSKGPKKTPDQVSLFDVNEFTYNPDAVITVKYSNGETESLTAAEFLKKKGSGKINKLTFEITDFGDAITHNDKVLGQMLSETSRVGAQGVRLMQLGATQYIGQEILGLYLSSKDPALDNLEMWSDRGSNTLYEAAEYLYKYANASSVSVDGVEQPGPVQPTMQSDQEVEADQDVDTQQVEETEEDQAAPEPKKKDKKARRAERRKKRELESTPLVNRQAKPSSAFDLGAILKPKKDGLVTVRDNDSGEEIQIPLEDLAGNYEKMFADGSGKYEIVDWSDSFGNVAGPMNAVRAEIARVGAENVFFAVSGYFGSEQVLMMFLKSNGVDIEIGNLAVLPNSKGQTKADWLLEIYGTDRNDVKLNGESLNKNRFVQDVYNQFDVKGKKNAQESEMSPARLDKEINDMLERSLGIRSGKRMTKAEGDLKGRRKGRFKFYVPPSAEDFKGLMYKLLGRGKQGDADMAFFEKTLFRPFAQAMKASDTFASLLAANYRSLQSRNKDIVADLKKNISGTDFTVEDAIRVYLWKKAGYEVPGLGRAQAAILDRYVRSEDNYNVRLYADQLSKMTAHQYGYPRPKESWALQGIEYDLMQATGAKRHEALEQWKDNKNAIFNENTLAKLKSKFGPGYVDALLDILYRMEHGTNRPSHKGPATIRFMNWVNGSIGATMWYNTRSAVLQMMSVVNFLDFEDNNLVAASARFANQKQYWADVSMLFKSHMLKQRRAGLRIDVVANEIAVLGKQHNGDIQSMMAALHEKGFKLTQFADSLAIALGGATYFRNKVIKYKKQGMTQDAAENQAFLDFQEIAEETQQSSRPDLISQEQAGMLGRFIHAWQNTPMQYARLVKKAISDLANSRGNPISNVSRILYYGALQNMMFAALQSGLAWLIFGGSDEEDEEQYIARYEDGTPKKEEDKTKYEKALEKESAEKFAKMQAGESRMIDRMVDSTISSTLRGIGVRGAALNTLIRSLQKYKDAIDAPYGRDKPEDIVLEIISISPPFGSKARKALSAFRNYKYNQDILFDEELLRDPSNPLYGSFASGIEAVTNLPTERLLNKVRHVHLAITGEIEPFQRAALLLGWSEYNIGVGAEGVEKARNKANIQAAIEEEEQDAIKRNQKYEEKVEELQEEIDEARAKQRTWAFEEGVDSNRDGKMEYRCAGIKTNGERCRRTVTTSDRLCFAHKDRGASDAREIIEAPEEADLTYIEYMEQGMTEAEAKLKAHEEKMSEAKSNQRSWAFEEGEDSNQDGKMEYRCVGIKASGSRCTRKVTSSDRLCYSHKNQAPNYNEDDE